jgi:hypothetical protein
MTAVTKATVQTLSDSIAKHIADLVTLTGGSTSAITAGQATTLGEIAVLNDAAQQYSLLDGFTAAINSETAWLASVVSYNSILDAFRAACVALDGAVTGGLAAFTTANQTLQLAPAFFDAFNRAILAIGKPTNALPAWQAFSPTGTQIAHITLTGSGAGTYAHDTTPSYGNAPLSIKNITGGNTGAADGIYTITYKKYSTAGAVLTGQTATATMPSGSSNGTLVALSGSAQGFEVTNITLTGGTAADVVAVVTTTLRSPAY